MQTSGKVCMMRRCRIQTSCEVGDPASRHQANPRRYNESWRPTLSFSLHSCADTGRRVFSPVPEGLEIAFFTSEGPSKVSTQRIESWRSALSFGAVLSYTAPPPPPVFFVHYQNGDFSASRHPNKVPTQHIESGRPALSFSVDSPLVYS